MDNLAKVRLAPYANLLKLSKLKIAVFCSGFLKNSLFSIVTHSTRYLPLRCTLCTIERYLLDEAPYPQLANSRPYILHLHSQTPLPLKIYSSPLLIMNVRGFLMIGYRNVLVLLYLLHSTLIITI